MEVVFLKKRKTTTGVLDLQTLSSIPQIGLPQHLITSEILVRLPIKSLIRFKSVSKEWKSIISSPDFARYHLHFQRSSPNYSSKLLFEMKLVDEWSLFEGLPTWYDHSFWVFDHSAYEKGSNPLCVIDRFRYGGRDTGASVVGCSDGLVLLELGFYRCYIWNPATRESRQILAPTFTIRESWIKTMWGFGYVPSADDYKIVCFSFQYACDDPDEDYRYKPEAFTLCLKAGTWKRVCSCVPYHGREYNSIAGVLVNEMSYWLFRNLCIVGFDLSSEEFIELDPPGWMRGPCKGYLLSVIEGCLCFCSFEWYTGRVDISMLKEHGGSTSWVKFYNVTFDTPFECLNVSGVWSGKFIICTSTDSAVFIDMSQDPPVAQTLINPMRVFHHPEHVGYYEESLASPFPVVNKKTKDDDVVADNLMESFKNVRKTIP